jgi:hypothetical protein
MHHYAASAELLPTGKYQGCDIRSVTSEELRWYLAECRRTRAWAPADVLAAILSELRERHVRREQTRRRVTRGSGFKGRVDRWR